MTVENESAVIRQLTPTLVAEGYDVYVSPNKQLLPEFFSGHIPDAIALRKDKNIAIQVINQSRMPKSRLEELRKIFEGRKDWELRLVYVSPSSTGPSLPRQSRKAIEQIIDEMSRLEKEGHHGASLLLGWGVFEAIGRALMPENFERPQTPGRLVQMLSQEGHLTPSQADQLRQLVGKRNGLIHGDLNVLVTKSEAAAFTAALRDLVSEL